VKYNQPYGVSDPNAAYVNGDPSAGIQGSIPPAASIEYPQREIVKVIQSAGLTPDNADLAQLAKGIQSGKMIFAVDSGPANLLSIALTPPLLALVEGMAVWVRAAQNNTGPATLAVNAIGGRNIVRRGGGVLQAGDIKGGFMTLLVYNGLNNNFELYGATYDAVPGSPVLVANSNLYVNTATGSDTLYDGTSGIITGPHGPFKTIQRAVNETFKYGPSVYTMTINVAAGTYPEAINTPNTLGPSLIIKGAGISATFVTGANNTHTFSVDAANQMTVQDLSVSTGTGTGPPCCFSSSGGASLFTYNTISDFVYGYVWSAYTGYVYAGTHTFKNGGSCMIIFSAFYNSFLSLRNNNVFTFQGPFNVSAMVAAASSNGSISVGAAPYQPTFVNPGYVTGQKYNADVNGVINTQGAGVNFFPGSVAGSTARGGQYA
jgi:hypothetical protein